MSNSNKWVILFDIDYTIFDTATFKESDLTTYNLYPQVKNILTDLGKKYRLGILSQGETDFQIQKLKETGIYELFDSSFMFITPDKHADLEHILQGLGDDIIFVEDKIIMLERAKKLCPKLTTIWFKNGPFITDHKFDADYTIDSFLNLPGVISQITR